jgi:hypothetical protein
LIMLAFVMRRGTFVRCTTQSFLDFGLGRFGGSELGFGALAVGSGTRIIIPADFPGGTVNGT